MTEVREVITISAPLNVVWEAMHVDLDAAALWSEGQVRMSTLDGGPPGKGSLVRYELSLQAGIRTELTLRTVRWTPPRHHAGEIVEGPIRGRWAYTHVAHGRATRVTYELDYELPGLMRFTGGLFKSQYAAGIRQGMEAIKAWVESEPRG